MSDNQWNDNQWNTDGPSNSGSNPAGPGSGSQPGPGQPPQEQQPSYGSFGSPGFQQPTSGPQNQPGVTPGSGQDQQPYPQGQATGGYGTWPSTGSTPTGGQEYPGYGAYPGYDTSAGYANQGYSPYQQPGYANAAYLPSSGEMIPRTALADWAKRALGGLIDWVAPALVLMIIYSVSVDPTTGTPSGAGAVIYYLFAFLVFVFNLYNIGYRNATTKSFGHQLAKTTLVSMSTGQRPSVGLSIVRYFAHIVDSVICYVGWLFPLWDNRRQTLADKMCSTLVVDDQQMLALGLPLPQSPTPGGPSTYPPSPAYYPPTGQPPYGTTPGSGYGQPPYGTTPGSGYGQPPYGTTPGSGYGGTGQPESPSGTQTSGSGYGYPPTSGQSYGNSPYNPPSYGDTGYGQPGYGSGNQQGPSPDNPSGQEYQR